MQVTVSVKGRLSAFHMARELQHRGHLNQMITSYPKFETVKWGVERDKITSLFAYEGDRIWQRAPRFLRNRFDTRYAFRELFDLHASYRIPEGKDVFVGYSSFVLRSLQRAKRSGAKTIVWRGSSHMLYQQRLLLEERSRLGLKARVAHPKIVEKELMEYAEADYILVPSRFAKRTFLEYGVPGDKLLHVPYGVDLTHFYPVPKLDDTFRIIYCGVIAFRKGVHYLLQAFSELKLPRAELWLIGQMGDGMRRFLAKYPSTVFHKGPFPEFELYKYYSQGSVFCLASIEEGLAVVQPQAMACGLPVICTTNTGGEDIVRDGQDGFVVPIRNVEALKEKISFFYENRSACTEMGRSAQRRVRSDFTWAHFGDKIVSEFKRVLSR